MDSTITLLSDGINLVEVIITSFFTSPLSWWILIIFSLFLIEKFELGPHSFSVCWWTSSKRSKVKQVMMNGAFPQHYDSIDGTSINGHDILHAKSNGVMQTKNGVPLVFHNFIRRQIIPKFSSQRQENNEMFAVLVLSRISSLEEIREVKFKLITFNGQPLVNSRLITYPQEYRYENYVVARSGKTRHPEALITKQVPKLVQAYGKSERCYLRNPAPKFGLLYSWFLPCSHCTDLIIERLSGVCKKEMVLAYSHLGGEGDEMNSKRLTDAGFTVVRVESG